MTCKHDLEKTVLESRTIETGTKEVPCPTCHKQVRVSVEEGGSTQSGLVSGIHVYHIKMETLK